MSITPARIHEFFATYGWQYEFDQETTAWHTGFRGDISNFNIFVHLTENWIYFSITPFVNAPTHPGCIAKLHQYLLRLNHLINLAKFGIDAEGDVVLTVELPTENLVYSEFADGLNALSFYADDFYRNILNVAQDPGAEVPLEDEAPGEESVHPERDKPN